MRSNTLGYDSLGRLTSATAPAQTYTYDPRNNLRSRVTAGQATEYTYDSQNRLSGLTGVGATSFGYDNRGNAISRHGAALSFDQRNQLTQARAMAATSTVRPVGGSARPHPAACRSITFTTMTG